MNSSQGSNFSWCWRMVRLPYSNRVEALYAAWSVIRFTEISVFLQNSDEHSQAPCCLTGKKKDASSQYWMITNGASEINGSLVCRGMMNWDNVSCCCLQKSLKVFHDSVWQGDGMGVLTHRVVQGEKRGRRLMNAFVPLSVFLELI